MLLKDCGIDIPYQPTNTTVGQLLIKVTKNYKALAAENQGLKNQLIALERDQQKGSQNLANAARPTTEDFMTRVNERVRNGEAYDDAFTNARSEGRFRNLFYGGTINLTNI